MRQFHVVFLLLCLMVILPFFAFYAWRGTGLRPTVKGDDFLFLTVAHRTCRTGSPDPELSPRYLKQNKKHPLILSPQSLPPPVEQDRQILTSPSHSNVARGPVPRDLSFV